MVSVVQVKRGNTTSAPFEAVFDTGISAGSIIVACCGFDNAPPASLATFADSHADTVTDSGLGLMPNNNNGVTTFCKAFFTPTVGEDTVTATFTGTPTYCEILIMEVAGLTSPVFDQIVGSPASQSGSPWTSGATGTLTNSVEFAIAHQTDGDHVISIDSPFDVNGNLGGTGFGWGYSYFITGATTPLTFSGTRGTTGGTYYSALVATIKSGGAATYQITGVTRDNTGNLIGSCDVFLLKYNSGTHLFTQIAHTTSDASTGAFTFSSLADNDPAYCCVAWKDGTPHVTDVSDRNVRPA